MQIILPQKKRCKLKNQKIGLISILPKIESEGFSSFHDLYNAVGMNTGNLLFTNAIFDKIDGEKIPIGYNFNPQEINEKYSIVVIPAANWLCTDSRFDCFMGQLAEKIKQLRVPCVVIGLGAQAAQFDNTFASSLGEGCVSFVNAISERSELISVRGWFTQSILEQLGIKNVCTTGCPSFSNILAPPRTIKNQSLDLKRLLLYPTRYWIDRKFLNSNKIDNIIFKFSFAHRTGLLFQSEAEEIAFLKGFPEFFNKRKCELLELYSCASIEDLELYLINNSRVFFDLKQWVSSLVDFDFGFGTRLHGTISMLNSGLPAILAWHDSRTREAAEFANIPTVNAKEFYLTQQSIEDLYGEINIKSYTRRRHEISEIFDRFLLSNNLSPTSNLQ